MQAFGMAARAILEEHWQLLLPDISVAAVRDGTRREAVVPPGVKFR